MPNEIPLVFHNISSYGNHCVVKELANDFERKSECYNY